MREVEWRTQVQRDGFNQISTVEWSAGLFNDTHTHDFVANIFVISGEMTVKTDKVEMSCGPGESGTLDAGVPHTELVGPEGVSFLIAQKPS